MVKGAVIFSDEDKAEKKPVQPRRPDSISLSRDEYRQIIKDAYHEGRDDALNEQKHEIPKQENEPVQLGGMKQPTKKYAKQKSINRQKYKTHATPEQKNESVKLEGKEEAIKIHAKEKEENRQRFKTITDRHEIEIMRAKSVFPFTLFPDTLVIDTTKVTIARKQLFATEYVATIPLKDLSDVNVQTVLFLGTLMIRYMPQSNTPGMNEPVNVRIPNLTRENAMKAKNILKGALVAKAEEIDIAKLAPDEVVDVLEKFGESTGVI
jgi:hypothetical protein